MLKKMIKSYGRILMKYTFWIGAAGIFLIMAIDSEMLLNMSEQRWEQSGQYTDIMMKLEAIFRVGGYFKLILILVTAGFAVWFCTEWNSGVVPQLVRRWGIKKYSLCYTVMAAISGGGMAVMGAVAYILYVGRYLKVVNYDGPNYNVDSYSYAYAVGDGHHNIALFFVILALFITGALAAEITLCFSTLTTNKYIVMIMPYLVFEIYQEIAKSIRLDDRYRIDFYFLGKQNIGNSYISTTAIYIGIITVILLGGYLIFSKGLRRKLHYEKY